MNVIKNLLFIFIIAFWQACNANNYCVALSGGSGGRLFPLSRINNPKQFLSINGNQTLLEDTLDRLSSIPNVKNFWISTTEHYKNKVKDCVGNRVQMIVAEPSCNNTGPAILLTCLLIAQEDPNAVIAFSPTDHYIGNTKKFAKAMATSMHYAAHSDAIVLLGVQPTRPATGYGYIAFDKNKIENNIAPVLSFHEKPNLATAEEFLHAENFLWNVGIFCASAKTFIEAFKKYASDLYDGMIKYLTDQREYETLPKESFDYAVLEKYPKIFVHPVSFEWSDIGDMKTFLTFQQCQQTNNTIIKINANENLVSHKKKLVALVDVDELCVVDTDDILLIIPQKSVNRIREVIAKLEDDPDLNNFRWNHP